MIDFTKYDLSVLAESMKKTMIENAGRYDEDGRVLLPRGQQPSATPVCNGCGQTTKWRGPYPDFNDIPLYIQKKGGIEYRVMMQPNEGEDREKAAIRLFNHTDKCGDNPMESEACEGYLHWAPAMCGLCLATYVEKWMDHVWPRKKSKGEMNDQIGLGQLV